MSETDEANLTIEAAMQLNELFSDWVAPDKSKAKDKMPSQWRQSYEKILLGLCRLHKFTLYIRIPPELWTLGWAPMIDMETLAFPSIPIEYLHDKDILQVYVKRLLILGTKLC